MALMHELIKLFASLQKEGNIYKIKHDFPQGFRMTRRIGLLSLRRKNEFLNRKYAHQINRGVSTARLMIGT
jgi:hypothetical protein